MTDNNRNIEIGLTLNDSEFNKVMDQIGIRLQRIGGQFNALATAFDGIGKLGGINKGLEGFVSRFTNGLKTKILPGLDDVIDRYDTLRTYSKRLSPLNIDTKAAQKSFDQLYDSVLGLPTAINDITKSARDLIYATGDVQKGTDLAEALNAFSVISGFEKTSDAVNRYAKILLSGGKLRTIQWQGFLNQLGTGLTFVGEKFGYTTKEFGAFQKALREGQIAGPDLMNAIIDTYKTNKGVQELLSELKNTLDAGLANIRISVVRGLTSVFQAFDKILGGDGQGDFALYLKRFSKTIDEIFNSVTSWIDTYSTEILDFFKRLQAIDFKSIVSNFLSANLTRLKIQFGIFEGIANNKGLLALVTRSPLISKGLSILGKSFSTFGRVLLGFKAYRVIGGGGLSSLNDASIGMEKLLNNIAKTGQIQDLPALATFMEKTKKLSDGRFKTLGYRAGNLGLAAGFIAIIGELAVVLNYIHRIDITPEDVAKMTLMGGAIVGIMALFEKFGNTIKRSVSLTKTANLLKRGGYIAGLEILTVGFVGIIKFAASVMKELHGTNWSDFAKFSALTGVVTGIMAIVEGFSLLNGVITSSVIGGAVLAVGMLFTGLQEILAAGFIKVVEMAAKCVKVVSGMGNVNYTEVRKKIEGILNIFDGLESNMPSPNLVKLQNDSSRIKEVADNLVKAIPNLLSISNSPLITPSQQNGIKLRIESVINTIKTIRDSILSKVEQYQLDEIEFLNFSGVLNGFNEFAKSFLAVPPMISHLLQSIQSIDGPLNEWKTNADSLKTKIGSIATTMYDLIGVIKEKFSPQNNDYPKGNFHNPYAKSDNTMELGEITELSKRIDILSEFSGKFLTIAPGIARMIDSISSIESHLNKWNSIRTTMKVNIITFLKDIGEIFGVIKSELLGLINSNMFHQFNNSVNQLVGESGRSGLIGRLDYMRDVIVRLASVGENDFSGLKTSLNNLFTYFSHIFDDGSVVTTGTSNLDLLGQSLSNFKKLIEQPFNTDPFNTTLLKIGTAVDTLNDKFINLIRNIKQIPGSLGGVSVNKQKTYRGTKAVGQAATGGIVSKIHSWLSDVYGSGTDTSPYMLTPGEFVIKKKVAQTLGYDVLNKLNSMDLMGAFSSMGFTPRLSYAKNSNNSYNNNASVVQNIYNAPQNYTQKRAGRFVKGLLR